MKKDYWRIWREKNPNYREDYYQRHPGYKEKHREYVREWRRKLKLEVFSHYSNSVPLCACCAITDIDVLCIDHINNDGKEHRRKLGKASGVEFYSWLKRANYPNGFQVLCANCNLKKKIAIDRGSGPD